MGTFGIGPPLGGFPDAVTRTCLGNLSAYACLALFLSLRLFLDWLNCFTYTSCRENELLKHQLKRYVGVVQTMRRERGTSTSLSKEAAEGVVLS